MVIFAPVTFLNQEGFNMHRLLRAIDLNLILSKLSPEFCADRTEVFYPQNQLDDIFQNYSRIIENTKRIHFLSLQKTNIAIKQSEPQPTRKRAQVLSDAFTFFFLLEGVGKTALQLQKHPYSVLKATRGSARPQRAAMRCTDRIQYHLIVTLVPL